jgi:hypothetical protein
VKPSVNPSVRCDVALPNERTAVERFTRGVATSLTLGGPYEFLTKVYEGDVQTHVDWCADGWTHTGVSIWLLTSPTRVELVFGHSLRDLSLFGLLRTFFSAPDRRLAEVDLGWWQKRLEDVVKVEAELLLRP